MRKLLLVVVAASAAIGLCTAIGTAYLLHQDDQAVSRAQMLASDLQKLTVGASDYKTAQVIATKYGTAPYQNDWGTMDCADDYFDRCAYMIPLHNPTLYRLRSKYPLVRHISSIEWSGAAS